MAGKAKGLLSNTPHPTSRANIAASRDVIGSATFSLKGRRMDLHQARCQLATLAICTDA
jgi:hypothetical protein